MATLFAPGLTLPRGAEPPAAFPYQGSKRAIVTPILGCIPEDATVLHEPFCGSAAVSLAAGTVNRAIAVRLNDNNAALVGLWRAILDDHKGLVESYTVLWHQQQDDPRRFYDDVRDKFNATGEPALFLYLLARCVKAAVRYNGSGEFNQSPDNRRLGAKPARMAHQLGTAARILRGRTVATSQDFRSALRSVRPSDIVYMDPPYQGVSTNRDRRYADTLDYEAFVEALAVLNEREVSYIISYDGRTGAKVHGKALPTQLRLAHFDVEAGWSSQATLAGRAERTVESLYLSAPLVDRLGGAPRHLSVAAAPR